MIIQTQKLTKHYQSGKVKALRNLNLEVKEGEIFSNIDQKKGLITQSAGVTLVTPASGSPNHLGNSNFSWLI